MPQSNKEVLFKVANRVGHEYVIYTDGSIEGFGEATIITNLHDALVDMAVQRDRFQRSANEIPSNLSSPAISLTSDCTGAEHGTPEQPAINCIATLAAPGEK